MTVRVLSLGCGDAYLEQWLQDQTDVHVDALDATVDESVLSRARARVNGNHRAGLAQHAPDHFKPGTYDAVLMLELLEHVPDTTALFASAERMVRPGGRVLLTTPDGCFGAGGNPNHLRAWTVRDAIDLVRRRGKLLDAQVGEDGITMISYQPETKRGDVAIFCGPCWQRWSPVDIKKRGLGGSETAAVRVAEQLSKLGWVVTVYADVDECCVRDVMYRNWRSFDPAERRAAVIVSRMPSILDRPVNADRRILWLHDVDAGPAFTERHADRLDHVVVLSRWHWQHVRETYPWLNQGKLTMARNGVHLPYFAREPAPEREQRVVYTSSPDRGLDVLLELWPRVLDAVPDAMLCACYAPVYRAVADRDPTVHEHAQLIERLADQPGVTLLPSLPHSEVADLMRSSLVWTHPSYCSPMGSPFYETSCIGAMEAQAAGCVIVASQWGALPETAPGGLLVDGPADDPEWRTGLVDGIVRGLTHEHTQQAAQARGPERAAGLGWDGVGDMFHEMIDTATRTTINGRGRVAA